MTVEDDNKPVGQVFFIAGELVLKPFAGFEHLFSAEATPQQPSPPPSHSAAEANSKAEEAVRSEEEVPERPRKRKKRVKRDTLEQSGSPQNRRAFDKKTTHTFHVSDVEGVKLFYGTRLRETGLKALRQIVTEWVKIVEPNRLRLYGAYHKKIPSKGPPGRAPPWWPSDVPYEEPAHLPVSCIEKLGTVIMLLQSSRIEKSKSHSPEESWTHRLHQAALYFISSTPAQEYCTAIDAQYSTAFKERALKIILPELFQVAQAHEEYTAQCVGCAGSDHGDTDDERTFSWSLLQRPQRRRASGTIDIPDAVVEDSDSKSDQTMAISNILNC